MKFWLAVLLVVGIAILGTWQQWWEIPREWNPWAPLHVADRVTPVTKWKLRALRDDRPACLAALATADEARTRYTAIEDHTPAAGCPLTNVVRVQQGGVSFNSAFTATCPLALAWLMYEQHGLQPAAESIMGSRVTRVEHFGSFACRNIYHRENARRSEHATAEALDVAAFQFADGRRLTVLRDWDSETDTPAARFLREARDQSCRFFGNTLGPEYNAAHANHFHFGMRGFRLCR